MKRFAIAFLALVSGLGVAAPAPSKVASGAFLPDPRIEPIPGARPIATSRLLRVEEGCVVEEVQAIGPVSAEKEAEMLRLITITRPGRQITTTYERPPETLTEPRLPIFRILACPARK